jgi:hypothetical protein
MRVAKRRIRSWKELQDGSTEPMPDPPGDIPPQLPAYACAVSEVAKRPRRPENNRGDRTQ